MMSPTARKKYFTYTSTAVFAKYEAVVRHIRKIFQLHWLYIKYMSQYSRTEYRSQQDKQRIHRRRLNIIVLRAHV